jgi:hypothetical protein
MSSPGICELSRQSTSPTTNVVHAVQFIRKMRGGSEPALIRCNDDKLYVVKFSRNRQGPNVLANEVLGSELLKTFNLPTPPWKAVALSTRFLKENSDAFPETPSGICPIESELQFGSEFLGGDETGQAYEWLPKGLSRRVANSDDFLGVHIFDVWMNHCDHRQSIFTTRNANASFTAVFIDNGHLCGGPEWKRVSRRGESLSLDSRFHPAGFPEQAIEAWISRFESLSSTSIVDVIPRIPKFWYSGDIDKVVDSLILRLSLLRTLLPEELKRKPITAGSHGCQIVATSS